MNNRMIKTRARKRYARSTHKKCIKCMEWKERRPCKHSKRSTKRSTKRSKSNKRKRMYGGRSDAASIDTHEGVPVIKETYISIDGMQGSLGLDAFKAHLQYRDQQGKGGTPGYDD